jgi:hypothetical protein
MDLRFRRVAHSGWRKINRNRKSITKVHSKTETEVAETEVHYDFPFRKSGNGNS